MARISALKLLLIASTSATMPLFSVAHAQEATGKLEEIVVTARRTAEAMQEAPISISAFSQGFLDRQNIQQVDKIAQFTPNLVIAKQPASLTAASILIRGVGQTEPSSVAEPGVGMYLDGVYIARTGGAILDLVDLERIEVLRGPQGTLFGRNTIGGAIQLVSRKPTDEFGFEEKAGYGSFNSWYTKTTLNTGYIAGSPFKATLSYMHRQKDGWVDNKLTPSNLDPNALNSDAIWLKVHGDISDKFKVDYSFDWNDRRGTSTYFQMVAATPDAFNYFSKSASLGGDPLILSDTRLRESLQAGFTDHSGKLRWDSRAKSVGHALTLEYTAGDFLTLKSISAYRTFKQDTIVPSGNGNLRGVVLDFTSPTLTSVQPVTTYQGNNAPQKQWQFSQELQATGHSGDWSYVAGIYYFKEKASEDNHQFLTLVTTPAGLVNLGVPAAVANNIIALNPGLDLIGVNAFSEAPFGGTSESYAVFGQASWKPSALDEKLELTAGLRYTSDRKTIFIINAAPTPNVAGKKDFTNVSWLGSATYKITKDIMVYGRVSTGYKSGGFNPRTSILNAFKPEKVLAFEGGVKAEWFDHRLRTNLAFYRTNYDDLQINQFASGSGGATSIIVNAGKAVIQGVEFEVTAVPVDGLTLTGSVGYTDPKYKKFDFLNPATNQVIDIADVARFSNLVKVNWSASAQYVFPSLGFGELTAQVNYSHRGRTYFHPIDSINIFNKQISSPGQGTLSARLTLSKIALGNTNANMEVSVWGENLANNAKLIYGIDFGGLGFGGGNFADPRSFGVDVKFKY